MANNVWDEALGQFNRAASILKLDQGIVDLLKNTKRELVVKEGKGYKTGKKS